MSFASWASGVDLFPQNRPVIYISCVRSPQLAHTQDKSDEKQDTEVGSLNLQWSLLIS